MKARAWPVGKDSWGVGWHISSFQCMHEQMRSDVTCILLYLMCDAMRLIFRKGWLVGEMA